MDLFHVCNEILLFGYLILFDVAKDEVSSYVLKPNISCSVKTITLSK